MDGISSSVLAAAAVTGLLALPIASDTVSPTASFHSANSSDSPVEITTRTSSENFVKTVSTAFDRFKINTSTNSSHSVLETPEYRFDTDQRPGKTVRKLETSTGIYRVVEASGKRVEETKLPEGRFVRKVDDGEVVEKFEGVNRSRADSLRSKLRERYEKRVDAMQTRFSDMNSGVEIDVTVQPDPSVEDGEYVKLRNAGSEEVDLDGWKVEDEASNSYEFDSKVLEPGESLKLYSNNSDAELNWDAGYVWNMDGDTAHIYNDEGVLVEEKQY
ncbi:MAG: lamin tail domain-containing protein [Candidatus Nanohaloarchaea archaeon]